ncbi:MAG: MopE-related protein, partial [Minicystis sp.]
MKREHGARQQAGSTDDLTHGRATRSARRGGPLVAQLALAAITVLGLGLSSSAGCSSGLDSAGQGGQGGGGGQESIGRARQAVVPTICIDLGRVGALKAYDAFITPEKLNTNYGAQTTAFSGTTIPGPEIAQAIFKFATTTIPPSAIVSNATLKLSQFNTGPGTGRLHRVTAPWDENTVTWASFGGAFSPTIIESFSNASASLSIPLTATVQGWVNGTIPNHGFLIDQPETTLTRYRTQEWLAVAQRPRLSVCYSVPCAAGTADCDGNAQNACEADLASPQSCGFCGNVCVVPNAAPACNAGVCAIGACNMGFADCNGLAADGCETLLTTSANCGACGVTCAPAHGQGSCAGGTCTLTACNAGFADCDGNPKNGCEPHPCADGSICATGADCASGVCAKGFCAAPGCDDGVKNGSETAIDCGGSCAPCGSGQGRASGSDCGSGVCSGGVCQSVTCSDGVKNGNETAADCGGGTCPPCAGGVGCAVDGDCASGVCVAGLCQGSSCNDGVKNGTESAVDCGGGACPPCASGKACGVGADCIDHVCQGGVCQMATCNDGVKNGAESDVDCGGTCAPCNPDAGCGANADCGSGVCLNGFCQAPTCGDGVKNGSETGVDCGGSCFKPETCNGIDDDCNGLVDEGLGNLTCGLGACQVTVAACVNGNSQVCTPGTPTPEACDGLVDDDCDGVVDDGCACTDGTTQSCYSGSAITLGVGACHAGVQTCVHGQWGGCAGEIDPSTELCNGLDDDCNGQADDGLGQTICGVGTCQMLVQNCLNGAPQLCAPSAPTAELCDGLDNDCNGEVDDGLGTIGCGVGGCHVNAPACVNGQPGSCAPGAPALEICDGIDNDCDGQTDEGSPGSGAACNTGKQGICAPGVTICASGAITCAQNEQPKAELCNGVDDDCDGLIDDENPGGGQACSTGQLGNCGAGTTVCSGGQLTCSQSNAAAPELCNGVDDDCDGVV